MERGTDRVLVIEDDRPTAQLFAMTIGRAGMQVDVAGTLKAARERLTVFRPDAVLLDVALPDGSGLGLIEEIRRREAAPAVVVVSGLATEVVGRALSSGARDVLGKPVSPSELVSRLRVVLDERRARLELVRSLAAERAARVQAVTAARRAEALVDAVRLVARSSVDNLWLTLGALTTEARFLLEADEASVHLIADGSTLLAEFLPGGAWGQPSPRQAARHHAADALTREALESGRPCFSADAGNDRRVAPPPPGMPPVVARLVVPLSTTRQTLGALYLDWLRPYEPRPAEIQLADAYGRHAAIAVQTAQVLDAERSARASAEERQLQLEAEAAEHARTAASLRASEKRYRRLVDGLSDVVFQITVGPPPTLTYVNEAVRTLLGCDPVELRGDLARVKSMIHISDVSAVHERIAALERGEKSTEPFVMRVIARDGRVVWLEIRIVPMADASGALTRVEGLARDVTARIQAARLNEQVARLEERQRIAMDLHDGVIQALYAVMLHLQATLRSAPDGVEWPVGPLGAAVTEIGAAIDVVREQVLALRGPVPARNLVAELHALAGRMRSADIETEVVVGAGAADLLSAELDAQLRLLASEAGSNIIRHAGARRAALRLERPDPATLALSVEDDGAGFEPPLIETDGVGLDNILHRIDAMGAEGEITTAPGHGTLVTARIRLAGDAPT